MSGFEAGGQAPRLGRPGLSAGRIALSGFLLLRRDRSDALSTIAGI